jgi:hypothetical protein
MQAQRNTKWFWLEWVLAIVVGYAVGTLVILPWMVTFAYAAQPALLTGLVGGAVLGVVLGGAQWLVLWRHARWVNGWWVPASIAGGMLGLGLGMELADMLTLPSLGVVTRGAALPVIAWQAALRAGVTGALVGLGLGGAQWLVLRRSIHRAGWWIIANGLGWLASLALGAALADLIGVLGALLLTSVTSGTITAWAMQRLRAASTRIIPPQSTTESTFE